MRLVVTEYPKSGGTWLVGLLGDALGLPKRDLYVDEGYRAFDVTRHPWYEGAPGLGLPESAVIKSHELPGSPLADFQAQFVHLVRDGRDVVVSKYFYERDFCVANGILERFDEPFEQYVPRVAGEWRAFVSAWLAEGSRTWRYEDLLEDTAGSVRRLLAEQVGLRVPEARIREAVECNTRERLRTALDRTFAYNTFVRKGVAGDWRNYFGAAHRKVFDAVAGETLDRLGYERCRVLA
jgi:hypothetical protein